jgi:lysyl endopeptidase
MKFQVFLAFLAALSMAAPVAGAASFRAPHRAPEVISLPAPKALRPPGAEGGKMRVGDVRALPKARAVTRWEPVAGGYVARLQAESPGALGLRVRLDLGTMPGAIELRVQGSDAGPLETMVVDPTLGTEAWTPWTEGSAQVLEAFSPVRPSDNALNVGAVLHFTTSPLAKAASSCTISTACTTGDAALDAAIAERKRSIMRIQFVSGGSGFVCSATLVDTPQRAAYVLTANHCIDTTAAANSVQSLWFYETTSCADTTNTAGTSVAGGMRLVFTNFNVDSTLMLMNQPPPANAAYAPLNAALLGDGTSVVSLSHPRGDSARFADGTMVREARDAERPYNMYFVNFTRGMIEGGSSGSGLFTRAGGGLALAGVLSQGPLDGSCDSTNKFGLYGRMEAFHPQIAQYIGVSSPGADDAPNRPTDVTATVSGSPIDTLSQPLTLSRVIDYPGDVDVFRFTLSTRTAFTAYTQGTLDLVSTILDAQGVALEANDDAQTVDTNTGITRELDPGTYYLHIAHWESNNSGPYSLVMRADRVDTNYTALWWNPAESGWGLNLNHQGNILFGTLFTYDDDGSPMWLVMSRGDRQADGSYRGALHRTSGPPFNASPWRAVTAVEVGTMHVAFSGASDATLRYSVNGRSVTKPITRQNFKTPPECGWSHFDRSWARNVQDLWWNPAESGWGVNFAHQENTVFATLFTYGPDGRGLWLVMPEGVIGSDDRLTGTLYRTRGPAFDASPWSAITSTVVGTMSATFETGSTGALTYTVDGVSVTKPIVRQVFSSPKTECVDD